MASSTPRLWVLLPSLLGLASLRCSVGGVGDPCIPEDEYQTSFSGYSVQETNVESRSFQCETRVCLVNHFRGRVSCPYGQTQAEVDSDCTAGDGKFDSKCCKLPGTTGLGPNQRVLTPVRPQLESRRAERAVYCSCRCANVNGKTDDGARYCECPKGFTCSSLIPNLQLGELQLAGSYCIKSKTEFSPTAAEGLECSLDTYCCPDGTRPAPGDPCPNGKPSAPCCGTAQPN